MSAVICRIAMSQVSFSLSRSAGRMPSRRSCDQEWEALLRIEDDRKRRIELEAYLDKGRGECHLRRTEVAAIVERSLLFGHQVQYELRAWVIMPNHVHLLFLVRDVPMCQLVDAWKGFTAKAANKILGRKGQLWQRGYWEQCHLNGDQLGRLGCGLDRQRPCQRGVGRRAWR